MNNTIFLGLNELSLFTGAGGGLLATTLLGMRPIGYVEFDDYCQQVLAQRIQDGFLPVAPIFTDIRLFLESGAAAQYRGFAQVVTAGWPCQPHSTAGKRQGAADEREGWPYVIETIRQVRPRWFLGENVRGVLSTDVGRYFGTILRDLAQSGYDCRWRILSAAELGAPHRRGLWPTIRANEGGCYQYDSGDKNKPRPTLTGRVKGWPTPKSSDATRGDSASERQRHSPSLVAVVNMWPTPTSHDAEGGTKFTPVTTKTGTVRHLNQAGGQSRASLGKVAKWATPQARDYRTGSSTRWQEAGKGLRSCNLNDQVANTADQLNPDWVEWLMNWPIGWTSLEPLPTHQWQRWREQTSSLWWEHDPADDGQIPRIASGMAQSVGRIRAIGNGQVPCVAASAWRILAEGIP